MIKYNSNTINDWNFGDDNIIKVYRNNAVCYYKITGGGDTPTAQTPCYAVVDDISQYQDTEFVDVFNKADSKWYKLNNLNQYEEYGIYGSGRTITTYEGKLTIDGDYEYIYSGSSWINVGEISGSTALEYIERTSTYNGYMPLGEYFTENTVIQMDFQMTQAKGNAIIGDYGSNDNDDWRVFLNYDSKVNNWLVYDFINFREHYDTGDWTKRFHLEIGNYYIKDLNTGNYLINDSAVSSFSRPNQMYLFHMDGTQSTNNIDYGKIYSVKIYQNGTLVKDLVPWTDENGNYGLYDNVSSSVTQSIGSMTGATGGTIEYPIYYDDIQDPPNNLSFSSMTEAEAYGCPWWGMSADIDNVDYMFCEGNEWLTKYVYQEVSGDYICDSGNKYKKMQEWDRNVDGTISATTNYIMGDLIESASTDCSSRLPSGYTEVEYIENSTSAYTETDYYPNQNTRVVAEFQASVLDNNPRMFGAGPWNGLAYIANIENTSPQKYYFKYGKTSTWYQTNVQADTNKHKFDLNKNSYYIDDVLTGTASITTFTLTSHLGIFNAPSASLFNNQEAFKGKCYYLKVYDDGTLVRDFVPCIRDNDNTVGLYDIVNDVFYTSNNNYTFIAGPSV